MQMEMERGGKLFFDLFVAMSNYIVSLLASLVCWFDANVQTIGRHYRGAGPQVGVPLIIDWLAMADQCRSSGLEWSSYTPGLLRLRFSQRS